MLTWHSVLPVRSFYLLVYRPFCKDIRLEPFFTFFFLHFSSSFQQHWARFPAIPNFKENPVFPEYVEWVRVNLYQSVKPSMAWLCKIDVDEFGTSVYLNIKMPGKNHISLKHPLQINSLTSCWFVWMLPMFT